MQAQHPEVMAPGGGEATAPAAAGHGVSTDPILSLPSGVLELQGQSGAVTGEPVAEADGRGSSAGDKELEQLGLT